MNINLTPSVSVDKFSKAQELISELSLSCSNTQIYQVDVMLMPDEINTINFKYTVDFIKFCEKLSLYDITHTARVVTINYMEYETI